MTKSFEVLDGPATIHTLDPQTRKIDIRVWHNMNTSSVFHHSDGSLWVLIHNPNSQNSAPFTHRGVEVKLIQIDHSGNRKSTPEIPIAPIVYFNLTYLPL
jgi:hypothetical protein